MSQPQARQCDCASRADFRLTCHGTITTITPLSGRCREWLEGRCGTIGRSSTRTRNTW